jgi:hypothetical protein
MLTKVIRSMVANGLKVPMRMMVSLVGQDWGRREREV